jgi:hypothetical protein
MNWKDVLMAGMCLQVLTKPNKTIRTAGIAASVRTVHLPNTTLQRYRLNTNLLAIFLAVR